jgi:hypothetical protein
MDAALLFAFITALSWLGMGLVPRERTPALAEPVPDDVIDLNSGQIVRLRVGNTVANWLCDSTELRILGRRGEISLTVNFRPVFQWSAWDVTEVDDAPDARPFLWPGPGRPEPLDRAQA